MVTKKKRIKKPPEPYWNDLVQLWFRFYRMHYFTEPSFDDSAPRDLKNIVYQLRTRCEKSNKEWSHQEAEKRLWLFLKSALDIPWLKSHFTLFNINRQKDIIFSNAANNALHQNS